MGAAPVGAEVSDDGQWWWDGEEWQPIGDDDQVEEGEPAFDFDDSGVRVDPEDSPVPSEGEMLKIGFTVWNTGTAPGTATVTLRIDDEETDVVWESRELEPGQWETPDGDGYVHDVPGQSEGEHVFEVFADPPGEGGGWTSNTIHVGSPEG